ncbi:MAG: reactive intermediate/imine deaminase [Desulfovibrio sp.]|nr:reactive intermediate/imine deaminase [Desulfovibrio sp.]
MNKQAISTKEAPAAVGPYSQGIISGGLIFLSGQVPLDPASGKIVSEDIEVQTAQVCKNLAAVLASHGLDLSAVVKTTVFITDISQFAKVNAVYKQYFPEPCPARSCVEVAALPLGAAIEIEAVAATG